MATDTLTRPADVTPPELAAVAIMGDRDGRYGLARFAHLRPEAVATYEEAYLAAAEAAKFGECDRCLAVGVAVNPDAETGGWSCASRC